jgi:hypothetical protein
MPKAFAAREPIDPLKINDLRSDTKALTLGLGMGRFDGEGNWSPTDGGNLDETCGIICGKFIKSYK